MTTTTTSEMVDEAFMERVFASKSKEKRDAWLKVLKDEEFSTVEDLRGATDQAWQALNIPIAVRDALRRHVSGAPVAATTAAAAAVGAKKGKASKRAVTQIDVIAFDVSGSMRSTSFDGERTRAEMGKLLFAAMVDKVVGAELASALGLVTFGERVEMQDDDFTHDPTVFEGRLGGVDTDQGATKLYDAIAESCHRIVRYRKEHGDEISPDCLARVFVLTDGDDNASKEANWKVVQQLREANVVLDAFPLAGRNRFLQGMAVASGGLCLEVKNLEQAVGLFEREAIIRLSARTPAALPAVPNSTRDLESLAQDEKGQPVTDVQSALPKSATAPVLCGAYELALASKRATAGSSKRAFKEFSEMQKLPPPGVLEVFMNADDVLFWKVILEGPPSTPYSECRWVLTVRLPTDYPFKPPQVRFAVPVYSPNVSVDGRICFPMLMDSWSPALSVSRVVQAIRALLEHPNVDDSIDSYKASLYKDNHPKYLQEARAHSLSHANLSADELKKKFNCA